jgi:hypothetical protein
MGMGKQDYLNKLELAMYRGGVPELLRVATDEWQQQEQKIIDLQQQLMNYAPPPINTMSIEQEQALLEAGRLTRLNPDKESLVSARVWITNPGNIHDMTELRILPGAYHRPYSQAPKEIAALVFPIFHHEAILEDVTTGIYEGVLSKEELLVIVKELSPARYYQADNYEKLRLEAFDRVWPRLKKDITKYGRNSGANRRAARSDFKRIIETIFENTEKRLKPTADDKN